MELNRFMLECASICPETTKIRVTAYLVSPEFLIPNKHEQLSGS